MDFWITTMFVTIALDFIVKGSGETVNDRLTQLKKAFRDREAKNLILFIGDGMGMSSISAARALRAQQDLSKQEKLLNLENLPYTGLIDTHCQGTFSAESGCTASAMYAGIKPTPNTLGVRNIEVTSCDTEKIKKSQFNTILELAKKSNMKVGVVTNTRITHATPAALYAKTSSRYWYSPKDVPKNCDVESIGEQFEKRMHEFDVAFGGGLRDLPSYIEGKNMSNAFPSVNFLVTGKELENFKLENSKPVIGVFAENHLYNAMNRSDNIEPSLSNMVRKAIDFLENKYGYVLVVENGLIDILHHANLLQKSLKELLELDNAISDTLERVNLDDTLVIVTADHETSLSFSGYNRGVFEYPMHNQTILNTSFIIYAYGSKTFQPDDEGEVLDDINDQYPAMIKAKWGQHGLASVYVGGDGPRAFLLTGVHEQTYIFKVIEYALGFNKLSVATSLIATTVSYYIFIVLAFY